MTNSNTTIVTVTHNSAGDLKKWWSNTDTQAFPWIVVDNNSKDRSAELANSLGAARVLVQGRNVGFAKACNLGLQEAETEIVGFVNPDVAINANDIPKIEAIIAKSDQLLSPQLILPDGRLQPNGRGKPYLAQKIVGRIDRQEAESNGYYIFAKQWEVKPVEWLIGACVFGRKSTFRRLGGWNERFFIYYEDADLGLRAKQAGVTSALIGSISWTHAWKRETSLPSLRAWKNELASMFHFYSAYPELFWSLGRNKR